MHFVKLCPNVFHLTAYFTHALTFDPWEGDSVLWFFFIISLFVALVNAEDLVKDWILVSCKVLYVQDFLPSVISSFLHCFIVQSRRFRRFYSCCLLFQGLNLCNHVFLLPNKSFLFFEDRLVHHKHELFFWYSGQLSLFFLNFHLCALWSSWLITTTIVF